MNDSDDPPHKRRRLDSVMGDLLKRAVEIGVEKATEAPDNIKELVGGMKLPKEIVGLILAQAEETKNGLFRVVAKEIREFLEHTNLATEIQKMLTTVQFEIATTIRFKPNDGKTTAEGEPTEEPQKMSKPRITTDVKVRRVPRPRRKKTGGEAGSKPRQP
jgi:hypothetical protein